MYILGLQYLQVKISVPTISIHSVDLLAKCSSFDGTNQHVPHGSSGFFSRKVAPVICLHTVALRLADDSGCPCCKPPHGHATSFIRQKIHGGLQNHGLQALILGKNNFLPGLLFLAKVFTLLHVSLNLQVTGDNLPPAVAQESGYFEEIMVESRRW